MGGNEIDDSEKRGTGGLPSAEGCGHWQLGSPPHSVRLLLLALQVLQLVLESVRQRAPRGQLREAGGRCRADVGKMKPAEGSKDSNPFCPPKLGVTSMDLFFFLPSAQSA